MSDGKPERIVASSGWSREPVTGQVRPGAQVAWGLFGGTLLAVLTLALLSPFPSGSITAYITWIAAGLLALQLMVAVTLSLVEKPIVEEEEISMPLDDEQRSPESPRPLH